MKGRGWGCGGQIEPPPPEKATFKKSSLIRVKLILSLPKKFNLYYWNITEDNQCFLCHHMQTQLQVMSNCEKKCFNRYTCRHDYVFNSLLQLYCNYITILDGDEMAAIELTICFRTNTLKSRKYKIKRYKVAAVTTSVNV